MSWTNLHDVIVAVVDDSNEQVGDSEEEHDDEGVDVESTEPVDGRRVLIEVDFADSSEDVVSVDQREETLGSGVQAPKL